LRVFVIFTDELKAKNRKILPAVLELMTKNYEKFTKKTSFFEIKRQKPLAIMLNA